MPAPVDTTSYSRHSLWATIFIIALSWGALLYPPLPLLTLLADSTQYRAMAASMTDGSFLGPVDISTVPHLASVMRPPLFPLALAATTLIPVEPSSSLVAFHSLLALAILVLGPFFLRKIFPPPLTALACGISLYSAKQVFWGEMSEWLAMNLVLSATMSYILWIYGRSSLSAWFTSLSVTLAILTRSALIPWLILPALMLAQSPRKARKRLLAPILLGLAPFVMWSCVQAHRFGSFTLGAYEGLNLLATARALGTIPTSPSDPPETRLVIERLNASGVTTSQAGLAPTVVHTWDGEFYGAFHRNFDLLCEAVKTLAPHSHIATLQVATRGFWDNGPSYREFLLGGLKTFTSQYALLPLAALCTAGWLWIRSPRDRPLAEATAIISCITVVYLASIFVSVLWLHRYFIPAQPSLIFLVLLSLATLIRGLLRSEP